VLTLTLASEGVRVDVGVETDLQARVVRRDVKISTEDGKCLEAILTGVVSSLSPIVDEIGELFFYSHILDATVEVLASILEGVDYPRGRGQGCRGPRRSPY